ncbi:hypothetical protein ACSFA8_13900 [Variovorax sp. RT4R15]|uniref:hypothetical protein n=1 Tax=Variovorax sp. RT4R15 TaxID=3443737 RepID=UPI003F472958
MTRPIEARGGIGNCVNAAWAAQVSGRPLRWRATGALRPDDLFLNPEALQLTDAEGEYIWLFPNIQPALLGTADHHPQHEGVAEHELLAWHWHWSGTVVQGSQPSRLQLREGGQPLPPGTIGVHVRTHHPEIECDLMLATMAVNTLTETATVFLASDTELPGLSSAVIRSALQRPEHDDDRARPAIESALHDWFTLGRCAEIHRIHASSTFVDHWCFAHGIPMKRLLSAAVCDA